MLGVECWRNFDASICYFFKVVIVYGLMLLLFIWYADEQKGSRHMMVHTVLDIYFLFSHLSIDPIIAVTLLIWRGNHHFMDKTDLSKELSEDMARESLIAISYGVADCTLTAKLSSPKDANGGIAIEPLVLDGEKKYRSALISISCSPSPDVELLPLLSPADLDG